MNFDPLPDADNAAVGSHNTVYGFLQETPQKASPVFLLPTEGERPESGVLYAMGSRVPA